MVWLLARNMALVDGSSNTVHHPKMVFQMKIVALAGGIGGAKLAYGLAHNVTRHLCRNTQGIK